MNRISSITRSAAISAAIPAAVAVATLATAISAHATIYDAKFSGIVQTQINSGVAVNSAISGEFIYDTALSAFTRFTIGSQSVAAGFASQLDLSPDNYTALYEAILSPVAVGGDVNSTFNVDLEGLGPWAGGSALALLSSSQLKSNLDTTASSFSYYMANSNGTNLKSLTASLTSLQVTAVPEPASLALLLAGVAVVGAAARRRTQG